MESQEVILSKLVLGYLKSEKCKSAYREFLKTSSYLQQLDISNPKYIGTRFLGLRLEDILSEYADISQIIQGRLEATNYYNEDHPRESLVEQLLYLLNRVPSSRPSTPGFSTPHGSHVDYRSPSHIDHSDLDATRADALPGNAPNEISAYSPRHKGFGRCGKSAPATSSPIEKDENNSDLFNTEMLAENLLENREFHEKIAQTINKVVERQFDTTVKAVIQETEQDPIFDKILDEIIGTSNNVMEISKGPDCNDTISSTTYTSKRNRDKGNDFAEASTPLFHKSVKDNIESVKLTPDSSNTAIRDPQQISGNSENYQQQTTNIDGGLDNYLLTSQCSLVTNPLFINTVTGLIIPPIIDATKSFVVLNKPFQPSPAPTGILSEHDIMKMPIILKDDTKTTDANNENKQIGTKSAIKPILPKQEMKVELGADAPKELKEYFENYTPEWNGPPKKTAGLKRVIYPKTRKSPNPVKKPIAKSEVSNTSVGLTPINENPDDEEVIRIPSTESKNRTPIPSETVKKATPKSGSHVRNLDFSTPPKLKAGRRKSDDSKTAAKTLFKQNDPKAWDADLRSIIQKEEKLTPKKKAPQVRKNKRKAKNTKLNTTEHDGMLLEAAIQTPLKNIKENQETNASESVEGTDRVLDERQSSNSQIKTVLSPSKLNACKNNIVDIKDGKSKFITPDMVKESVVYPITANRNITSMLETPLKVQQIPKTPGVLTPLGFNVDGTPFYDMLKANLNGMDLNSIQTPSVLISPDIFPLNTPNTELISPYPNRPTDYSTGSSYYQPSDNEQNKNLEAHIREVEKCTKVSPELTIGDHLQIFNKNIIGKKNLNLIRNNVEELEYSSCHSTDEEKQEESSMEWCEKESNETIIFKKKTETPKRTYSLRTRTNKSNHSPKVKALATIQNIRKSRIAKKEIKKATKVKKPHDSVVPEKQEPVEEIKSIVSQLNENEATEAVKSEPSSVAASKEESAPQRSVLDELEKKRLRVINSFKTEAESTQKPKKQANSKFKIKPIAKVYTTKTGKKVESPRKRKKAKQLKTLLSDLITSDDSDVNISISEDEEEVEEKNKNENLPSKTTIDKPDKNSSDLEAQNLIEGLKERGIHLMHNKSPKKTSLEGKDNGEVINSSDLQLESIDREYFDMKSKEGEDITIVFDETQTTPNTLIDDPSDSQKTEYIGKLYLESIDKEIDIHLKLSNFFTLIDIPSKQRSNNKQVKTKTKDRQEDETQKADTSIQKLAIDSKEKTNSVKGKSDDSHTNNLESKQSTNSFHTCQSSNDVEVDDDLMNFAVSGKEKVPEEGSSPKRSKKRRISDESESENSRAKILKTLDVDSFLNTIHCRPKQ